MNAEGEETQDKALQSCMKSDRLRIVRPQVSWFRKDARDDTGDKAECVTETLVYRGRSGTREVKIVGDRFAGLSEQERWEMVTYNFLIDRCEDAPPILLREHVQLSKALMEQFTGEFELLLLENCALHYSCSLQAARCYLQSLTYAIRDEFRQWLRAHLSNAPMQHLLIESVSSFMNRGNSRCDSNNADSMFSFLLTKWVLVLFTFSLRLTLTSVYLHSTNNFTKILTVPRVLCMNVYIITFHLKLDEEIL